MPAGPDAGNVLQFLDRLGINSSHGFQRSVLENHVGRHLQVLAHPLAQVLEHLVESRIHRARRSALRGDCYLLLVKVTVLHYFEGDRFIEKIPALVRHLQDTVIVHILLQVAGNERLADNSVPDLLADVIAATELFQVIVFMRTNFVRGAPDQNILNIIVPKIFFRRYDYFKHFA